MKSFNISKQNKRWAQAYKKEYVNQLQNQTNSLYEYLHYYNPEWRVLGSDANEEKDLSYFIYNNSYIDKESLINVEETCVDLWKLHFRWGFKNRFSHEIYYGENGNESEALSIGATIYKKDSYDLDYLKSNYNREEFLSHFIVFEAALAQYVTWTISTGTDENGKIALIYTYHLSNELDFGLRYNIQVVESTPRYFYNGTYGIKYNSDNFDTTTLLDYINTNVQYTNNPQSQPLHLEPEHTGTDYQHWCGATTIFHQTVYVDNNEYEELIADTVLYERPGKTSEYQVRFNKQSTNHPQIEDKFEVIFS